MARAFGSVEVKDTAGTVIGGAAVDLLDATTLVRIVEPVYADPTSSTTLTLPLTTNSIGVANFYLASGKFVVARYTRTGINYDSTVPVTDPTASGGTPGTHTHAAGDVTTGSLPLARVTGVLAADDLTDIQITGPAVNHELIRDGAKFFNILHRYRPQAYNAALDGTTDDSTAINSMLSDMNSAGRGHAEFPNKVIRAQNLAVYSNAVIDLNGATIKLPNSAAANADVFRGNNFDTLIGTNGTGGVYRFEIMNGRIDGNRANNANGRHGLAIYGVGTYRNLMVHDTKGNGIWAEWNSGSTQLAYIGGAPGVADGDQTGRFYDLEVYDCEGRVSAVGADWTIPGNATAVTNVTNPQITWSEYHTLRAGQVITIANVLGATGVNGVKTVLAVVDANNFTITNTAPGVFSASGSSTITYTPKAAVYIKGMDSPKLRDLEIWQSAAGFIPGMRGLLLQTGGADGDGIHIYQNFPVALDILTSNQPDLRGIYVGGHDIGVLVRNNYAKLDGKITGSATNSIGLDVEAAGGCHQLRFHINSLAAGSYYVRSLDSGINTLDILCVGDGSATNLIRVPGGGTLTTGTGGHLGWIKNRPGSGITGASYINVLAA